MSGRIVLILCLLALAAPAGARPVTQPALTPPDRTIRIQTEADVYVLEFTADSKSVYAEADVRQVNVWRVILYHWPEAAAVVSGLLLLRRLIRVARLPQVSGEEHCRRCNYLLKNLLSQQCPECGTELTPANRLPGRRRRPRVVVVASLLTGIALAYLLTAHRLPREGRPSDWLDWRSMRLAEWAEEANQHWITRHVQRDHVVFLVNVNDGSVRKFCRVQLGDNRASLYSVLSADRRFLFCTELAYRHGDTIGVAQIDLATGKVIRRFEDTFVVGVASRTLFIEGPYATPATPAGEAGGRGGGGKSPPRAAYLRALDIQSGKKVNELFIGEFSEEVLVAPTPGRDLAVVVERRRGTARVWDPVSGQILRSFAHEAGVRCVGDGQLFQATVDAIHLRVTSRDILTGDRTNLFTFDKERPLDMAAGSGTLVITCGHESGCLAAFSVNVRTGDRKQWAMSHGRLTLSPDGRSMALSKQRVGSNWLPRPLPPEYWDIRIYTIQR
ncbi:MAG: hypothetical protein ACHRHE_03290 [Tepidisphaerales bacterium]